MFARLTLPAALFLGPLAGCTATAPEDAFARRIDALLAGRDAAIVQASALTGFAWASLCFERGDTLLLRFKGADGKQVLSLPYERFFVDEGFVSGSLADECLAPGDRILVKKKHPGHEGPIEFRKAPQEG